ncbi:MAG: hypothetical protein AB8B83_01695 [Bdellovibrionales bacterium]
MSSDVFNFSRSLESLTDQDMYAISQELNTIEPSVGEVTRILPLLQGLTFLDYVSIAFVLTIIVFSMMPKLKKTKAWSSLRAAVSK